MKKIFLIFAAVSFANVHVGYAEYFNSYAIESAINEAFPSDLQPVVAAEYMAQIDENGEIDANGFANVCYAGGYDISTEDGAKKCNDLAENARKKKPKYSAPYGKPQQCASWDFQNASKKCNYIPSGTASDYTNPTTSAQKLQKCIFDKTMDFVIRDWEKGFQQTKSDVGNRICKDSRALYTDGTIVDLKNIDPDKTIQLGATKFGITTCASNLSVECVCVMDELAARQYYWTSHFKKYKYNTLPPQAMAIVVELSVAGVGKVAKELRAVVKPNCKNSVVITDCIADSVKKYIETNGVQKFYDAMAEERSRTRKKNSPHYRRAQAAKGLSSAYTQCGGK